jgi:mono/diheme cytochrome c family protein
MTHSKLVSLASMALLTAVAAAPAAATPQMVKQAKDAGFPAQNCQYCHTVAVPKKEGFKPDELNERGKWLLSEKEKQKAKDVKPEWLKNYTGK